MNIQSVKRVLLSITAASIFAVGFTTTVHAMPAIQLWNPTGALVFDGDGNIVAGSFYVVISYSEEGIMTVTAKAKDVDNSSGVAVHYDINNNPLGAGQQCWGRINYQDFYTDDWEETVSASGNVTMKCKFRDAWPTIP